MGYAFAAVLRPRQSLVEAFGRDRVAIDAAANLAMDLSKAGVQRVFAILKSWNKVYRGPKISVIFAMLNRKPRPVITDTHRPQLD